MTGARVLRIKDFVQGGDFMLTYGDGVSDVDIGQLVEFHKSHGKILTVTGVRPPGRFGEMVGGADGKVLEFNEKPQAAAGRINGGYFVASPKIFEYLDDREDLVFEQQPILKLVKDDQLMMFEHNGFWQPMDTSREHQLLNALYEKGDPPWVR
jgi:glucose-1-phosphate cytidylyltransferase